MKPLEGKRLLLLEDDYYLATDAREWLEEAGAEIVGPAANGRQALSLLSASEVDGAVLDINVGSGPNFDVARELSGRSVPVLFATGYDRSILPPEFQNSPRVEKPFGGAQLVGAVQAMLKASAG